MKWMPGTVRCWRQPWRWLMLACGGEEDAAVRQPVPMPDPTPIDYPVALWDRQVEGETEIMVHVNEFGDVDSAYVAKTSGFIEFDSAAVAAPAVSASRPAAGATATWRCGPASRSGSPATPPPRWAMPRSRRSNMSEAMDAGQTDALAAGRGAPQPAPGLQRARDRGLDAAHPAEPGGGRRPDAVYAKAEFFNPGGSVKDRIGLAMIEAAERDGRLRPGGVVVEGTSGNTGVGLAIAAAIKGYRCIFTMPDKMSQEKVRLLKAFGAEVIITPTAVPPDHPDNYVQTAKRIAADTPGAVLADQFYNPSTRRPTTPRRARNSGSRPAAASRTWSRPPARAARSAGAGRYLKERNPRIRVVAGDPQAPSSPSTTAPARRARAHRTRWRASATTSCPAPSTSASSTSSTPSATATPSTWRAASPGRKGCSPAGPPGSSRHWPCASPPISTTPTPSSCASCRTPASATCPRSTTTSGSGRTGSSSRNASPQWTWSPQGAHGARLHQRLTRDARPRGAAAHHRPRRLAAPRLRRRGLRGRGTESC
jgi:cysteine synthase